MVFYEFGQSGTWVTGSVTVNEIAYYNVIMVKTSPSVTEYGIGLRAPGINQFIVFSMNPRSATGFTFDTALWTVSGTKITKGINVHVTWTVSGGTGNVANN